MIYFSSRSFAPHPRVSQKMLAIDHVNFQFLLQWQVEQVLGFLYKLSLYVCRDRGVFEIEKSDYD